MMNGTNSTVEESGVRPVYEKPEDIANQKKVAAYVGRRWKLTPISLPRFAHADYVFVKGDSVDSVAEIKCRKNTLKHYDTYMVGLAKLTGLRSLASGMCVPGWLIVRWEDALGCLDARDIEPASSGIGGREDRYDEEDKEPVIHIPTDCFKILWTKER